MKILYDHQTFSLQKYGGISRYFFELIREIGRTEDIDVELALKYSKNEYLQQSETWARTPMRAGAFQARMVSIGSKTLKLDLKYKLNMDASAKKVAEKDYTLFHPTYYDNYFLKHIGDKPIVLTVFDMIHELYPEMTLTNKTMVWKRTLLERADEIIAISANTKKDILELYDIDPSKIHVIYLATSLKAPERRIEEPSERQRYLLFVGNRGWYKNFYFYLQAIAPILIQDKSLNIVCAGGGDFDQSELNFFKNLGLENRIKYSGANDTQLLQHYTNALAFVFPSTNEGFGIPVLEAISCGCPCIVSRAASIPEVGGDAAIYFDPKNVISIREATERVITDENLRKNMREQGLRHASNFSWQKTVKETADVYRLVASRRQ